MYVSLVLEDAFSAMQYIGQIEVEKLQLDAEKRCVG